MAGEVQADWPQEALRAQAVIARTFTVQRIAEGKTKHGTDASTDPEEFQAYAPDQVTAAVREAVAGTRGQVLTFRGTPIHAFFHSCAGGMTALASEADLGIGDVPYLRVRREPPCAAAEAEQWQAAWREDEVRKALTAKGLLGPKTTLRPAQVVERGQSGRATVIRLGDVRLPAPELRLALDPTKMRSTLLEHLTWIDGELRMSGRGWGHGVGLSQWGAYARARQGWDARRILGYYYPGTTLTKRWR